MYPPNPVPSQGGLGPPSYVVAYSGPPPRGPLQGHPQGPVLVANTQQAPNNPGSGGDLKNTVIYFLLPVWSTIHCFPQFAHSAVGGVGLGAGKQCFPLMSVFVPHMQMNCLGSAIGGGIINSLF